MAGHNSGRARTFCFSEGVNGFFSAANCDFYLPLSHWIPQRSLSQVASDRLQSFFVHQAVACFFELSRLDFAFPRLLQWDPGSYCRRLSGLMGYGHTTRKVRDNPLFGMDSPQSPSVRPRREESDVMIEE